MRFISLLLIACLLLDLAAPAAQAFATPSSFSRTALPNTCFQEQAVIPALAMTAFLGAFVLLNHSPFILASAGVRRRVFASAALHRDKVRERVMAALVRYAGIYIEPAQLSEIIGMSWKDLPTIGWGSIDLLFLDVNSLRMERGIMPLTMNLVDAVRVYVAEGQYDPLKIARSLNLRHRRGVSEKIKIIEQTIVALDREQVLAERSTAREITRTRGGLALEEADYRSLQPIYRGKVLFAPGDQNSASGRPLRQYARVPIVRRMLKAYGLQKMQGSEAEILAQFFAEGYVRARDGQITIRRLLGNIIWVRLTHHPMITGPEGIGEKAFELTSPDSARLVFQKGTAQTPDISDLYLLTGDLFRPARKTSSDGPVVQLSNPVILLTAEIDVNPIPQALRAVYSSSLGEALREIQTSMGSMKVSQLKRKAQEIRDLDGLNVPEKLIRLALWLGGLKYIALEKAWPKYIEIFTAWEAIAELTRRTDDWRKEHTIGRSRIAMIGVFGDTPESIMIGAIYLTYLWLRPRMTNLTVRAA